VTWDPVNLANLAERPPVTPSIGGLVYPGGRHVFSGPPESGKTFAAYALSLDQIREGNHILVADFEMGPYQARDRLRDMGATNDELGRLLYVNPWTPATVDALAAIIDEFHPVLVTIDAAAGAYGLHGLDDNRRLDVEAFAIAILEPFRQRNVATITLDHVTKNADTRGAFAIGSERKVGGADVHLGFETIVPFGRGRTGLVKIKTHKDRLGHLPRPNAAELELRSDPDTHAISWAFREPVAAEDSGNGWRPTLLMDRVLERVNAPWYEPVSRSALANSVRGERRFLLHAIDTLIVERKLSLIDKKVVRERSSDVPEPEANGNVRRSCSTQTNDFANDLDERLGGL